MKKFVELIQCVHQERYSVVINKIVAEKIPVAFLSVSPIQNAVATVKNLRAQGVNITNLISTTPPPPEMASERDFQIIPLDKISTSIYSISEYILVLELTSARVALKYLPNRKVIWIGLSDTEKAYQVFMNNLSKLQTVYESLIDEKSRETFCGFWLGKISGQFSALVYSDTSQYIMSGFIPKAGDIVIDCGACDGGTSLKFVNLGCKVYAFEMDKINFEITKKLATEKGFIAENFGLGSYNHKMKYIHEEGNLGASRLDNSGAETAQIIKLDTYLGEHKIPRVDFIKMDVEGAESDILRGAATTIARDKPILALSAYHKLDDFWTLMNFVKSIRSDYEFALRHYGCNSEDLPSLYDENFETNFYNLGLEPEGRNFGECVLFAR